MLVSNATSSDMLQQSLPLAVYNKPCITPHYIIHIKFTLYRSPSPDSYSKCPVPLSITRFTFNMSCTAPHHKIHIQHVLYHSPSQDSHSTCPVLLPITDSCSTCPVLLPITRFTFHMPCTTLHHTIHIQHVL